MDSILELFNVTVTPTTDDVELKFQVRMTDPEIQSLMDDDQARYSFRWKCSSTIATAELQPREASHYPDSTGFVGWIDQQDIRRTVRVELKIIATTTITNYHLTRQHPDYGQATFTLLPGDIIADGGYIEFESDKLYDPLQPPVGSCFIFVADQKLKKGLAVRFHDNEHVQVAFPAGLLSSFAALGNNPQLQISLVVLPALMQTIMYIKENLAAGENGEDLSEKTWAQAIQGQVDSVGSFEEQPFELAQKILGQSLEKTLLATLESVDED